ncbi:hypothetical protein AYI68_g4562 [Smittium mucronatum]|uniref:Uncharacterized protein n=1 Tax=Smittium mucronatum TaxID=133383 RepID=A0A1R0GWW8_9FUNG|nr:hypothetical protein AYI68_g4562 [Smittium mucronatum]
MYPFLFKTDHINFPKSEVLEDDILYQLDWYKSSLRIFCFVTKDKTPLSTLLLASLLPLPSKNLRAAKHRPPGKIR